MNVILDLSSDEVKKKIPYELIAETTLGSRWNTGVRKRLMNEWFKGEEIVQLPELKREAVKWALRTGVPVDGVRMTAERFGLWEKFGAFCARL